MKRKELILNEIDPETGEVLPEGACILLVRRGNEKTVTAIKRVPFEQEKVYSLSLTEAEALLEWYVVSSGDSNTFFK